jgi:hypothetical protein
MGIKACLLALVGAAAAGAAITALTFPLARTTGLEPATTSALERVTGFTLATCAMLLVVHTPVLVVAWRIVGLRLARMWAAIGSVILVFLVFMLLPVMETRSLMPIMWNVEAWFTRPLEFTADWLPFFAAAAVYGDLIWKWQQQGNVGRERAV